MGFADWLSETARNTRDHGVYGLKNAYHELMKGGLMRVGKHWNYGEDIYRDDWDALLVLDGCRADLLESVADEYDFLENAGERHVSNASASDEWIRKNLVGRPAQTEDVCYVSANPHDSAVVDAELAAVERLWDSAWDEEINTVPPETVTDTAIALHREDRDRRLLVHYMQPHEPFVPSGRQTPFLDAKLGQVTGDQLWAEYQDNLRYVLDDVGRLLENVDAERVIVTADHGEALNDAGVYGHRSYVPVRGLKTVPWCETTATDTGSVQPDVDLDRASDETSVEEKLEHLGYR